MTSDDSLATAPPDDSPADVPADVPAEAPAEAVADVPGEGRPGAPVRRGSVSLIGIRKSYGAAAAIRELSLTIAPGEFFALVGPSGSGKTTCLRVIAGLEPVDDGTVEIDGRDVTAAPPGDRDIAMVFQNYALYPHMTVADNIAFPLKMVGTSRSETAARVRRAAERVRMEHLLGRRPGQLSGGQQQRVALARAIVREPTIFLLDEPLSNLDAQLRLETRVALKRLQLDLGVTAVYVTHDQEEAFTLADRMAIFMDGEVVQVGEPQRLFDRPDDVRVAAFLGRPPMNLVPGTLGPGGLSLEGWDSGPLPVFPAGETAAGDAMRGDTAGGDTVRSDTVPAEAVAVAGDTAPGEVPGRPVTVGFRPRDLRLAPASAAGQRAEVYLAEVMGEQMIVNVRCGDHVLKSATATATADAGPPPIGADVRLRLDPADLHLFDRESGRRLDGAAVTGPRRGERDGQGQGQGQSQGQRRRREQGQRQHRGQGRRQGEPRQEGS
jgi:multiple sugar transport system ATP-binding protein